MRSTCRRNCRPSPAPSCAPSMIPGMSAATKERLVALDHPEHRGQGGERVVADLRPRRADPGEQGRLARVGGPQEAHVGEEPQVETQPPFLARLAGLRFAGGPIRVGEEGQVPPATATAARHPELVPVVKDLAQQGPGGLVAGLGARRHPDQQILSAPRPVRLPGPPWWPRSARNSVW